MSYGILNLLYCKMVNMNIEDQNLCLLITDCYLKRRALTRIPKNRDNTLSLNGHTYTLVLLTRSNT